VERIGVEACDIWEVDEGDRLALRLRPVPGMPVGRHVRSAAPG
jgi:hypothetical protein